MSTTAAPPELLALANEYYQQQSGTARQAAELAERLWKTMPTSNLKDKWTWLEETLPALSELLRTGQLENVERSIEYLQLAAEVQGLSASSIPDFIPESFITGVETADDLLAQPMRNYTNLVMGGVVDSIARQRSQYQTVSNFVLLTQDAGRGVVSTGTAASTSLRGYYRKVVLPCCSRCAILSGRWYNKNADFNRHPHCDCVAIPAAARYEDLEGAVDEAFKSGKVTGLSKADQDAIASGADASSIVNAKRKSYSRHSNVWGRDARFTSDGAGGKSGRLNSRSWAWLPPEQRDKAVKAKLKRLRPDEIIRRTVDDEEQRLRLLRFHGYIR